MFVLENQPMIIEPQIANIASVDSISDAFGRTFKTLRVSLINSCNLACTYCVEPSDDNVSGSVGMPKKLSLDIDQFAATINRLYKILNLTTIRLTGGEPLLYKQLIPLISEIKKTGIEDVKMTSNGILLAAKAEQLKAAGLTSVNISLDAIDPLISYTINRRAKLSKIMDGIEKAIAVGLKVKINCVVIKGVNDNQILPLLNYCGEKNITIRFLELMQMGHLHGNFEQLFFSEAEILGLISRHYKVSKQSRKEGATANYWITENGYRFGIISNESNPFCNDCNRLRLDSYGNIYGCLSDNTPISVVEDSNNETALKEKLFQALLQKKTKFSGSKLSMLSIGG